MKKLRLAYTNKQLKRMSTGRLTALYAKACYIDDQVTMKRSRIRKTLDSLLQNLEDLIIDRRMRALRRKLQKAVYEMKKSRLKYTNAELIRMSCEQLESLWIRLHEEYRNAVAFSTDTRRHSIANLYNRVENLLIKRGRMYETVYGRDICVN